MEIKRILETNKVNKDIIIDWNDFRKLELRLSINRQGKQERSI